VPSVVGAIVAKNLVGAAVHRNRDRVAAAVGPKGARTTLCTRRVFSH
jgi:hypothetical protein